MPVTRKPRCTTAPANSARRERALSNTAVMTTASTDGVV
jgi:hypothetical protein